MRPELQQIARIEAYLEGQLSTEERQAFESQLSSDPVFKQEVELQEQLTDRLNHHALVQEIRTAHEEFIQGEAAQRMVNPTRWIRFFGIFLLVLGLGLGIGFAIYSFQSESGAEETSELANSRTEESTPPAQAVSHLNFLPEQFQVPFNEYTFQVEKGARIKDARSGCIIHIPPSALVDQEGNRVTGEATLYYREFRNQADMAFSGIPMAFEGETGINHFNSGGMLEIKAQQNGQDLQIGGETPITLDFKLTERLPDLDFYQLDSAGQTWKQLEEIVLPEPVDEEPRRITEEDLVSDFARKFDSASIIMEPILPLTIPIPPGLAEWARTIPYPPAALELGLEGIVNLDVSIDQEGKVIACTTLSSPHALLTQACLDALEEYDDFEIGQWGTEPTPYIMNLRFRFRSTGVKSPRVNLQRPTTRISRPFDGTRSPVLDAGASWIGEIKVEASNYLFVISLEIPEFGIFNCDQVYRIPDRVEISANYRDEAGNPIEMPRMLSVIDLDQNAAFSFMPAKFSFGRSARNILLLATGNGKLYGHSWQAFQNKQIQGPGVFTFQMEDLSEQVETPEELLEYLSLQTSNRNTNP